jgi:predicted O-linked N-acetylglucosamine transferase (SPINDLY family)
MLDTFVVNAHTTTTDALWAGLPVLTLQGDTFASRVAASVLTACGTEQTVCKTEGEYEDAAVALATDNGRLGAIRSQLKDRASTRLFDTDNYVSDLENAFDIIGGLRNAGEQPRHVAVTTI